MNFLLFQKKKKQHTTTTSLENKITFTQFKDANGYIFCFHIIVSHFKVQSDVTYACHSRLQSNCSVQQPHAQLLTSILFL